MLDVGVIPTLIDFIFTKILLVEDFIDDNFELVTLDEYEYKY